MARELTDKQEKFIAEYLVNGRNASAAYRHAYDAGNMADATVWANASRLLRQDKVATRVAIASEEIAQNLNVTIESLTNMTQRAYEKAMADDKGAAAMVSAIQLMGKLHGLIVDKKESKNHNFTETADDLRDDELAAIARPSRADPVGPAVSTAESDRVH